MSGNPLLTLGVVLTFPGSGLEACADACEHAAECVRTVIMKNT